MNKNTTKAFTLVEMLIVIVIIGILIASLMPRMQQAQSRARDVTRKNDLAQMQTAIISYLWDKGELPGCTASSGVCDVADIQDELKAGGLDVVPIDPIEGQKYLYGVTNRSGHPDQWFRLAANTEVAWASNYVVCNLHGNSSTGVYLTWIKDTATFQPCKYVKEDSRTSNSEACLFNTGGDCSSTGGNFWYVVTY